MCLSNAVRVQTTIGKKIWIRATRGRITCNAFQNTLHTLYELPLVGIFGEIVANADKDSETGSTTLSIYG